MSSNQLNTLTEFEKEKAEEILYNYWKETPPIKTISKETYELMQADVRDIIVRVLREGIEDEVGGVVKKRHVISAQELLPLVNQERETNLTQGEGVTQIRMSTIYYHLDILIDAGLIKEVVQIKEGRHKTRYFGRTAKLFLGNFEEGINTAEAEEVILNFSKVLKLLNPEIEIEYFKDLLNKIFAKTVENAKIAFQWLEDHQEELDQEDINLHMFADTMHHFFTYDDELIKLRKEIARFLNLDVNE